MVGLSTWMLEVEGWKGGEADFGGERGTPIYEVAFDGLEEEMVCRSPGFLSFECLGVASGGRQWWEVWNRREGKD